MTQVRFLQHLKQYERDGQNDGADEKPHNTECFHADRLERAKEAVRRYLETGPDPDSRRYGWQRLAELCQDSEDWSGELHARVELCQLPSTEFETISEAANRLNGLLVRQQFLDTEEKRVLAEKLARIMDARLGEADGTLFFEQLWRRNSAIQAGSSAIE